MQLDASGVHPFDHGVPCGIFCGRFPISTGELLVHRLSIRYTPDMYCLGQEATHTQEDCKMVLSFLLTVGSVIGVMHLTNEPMLALATLLVIGSFFIYDAARLHTGGL